MKPYKNFGNDTIDCYPPWDTNIEKILCVSGKVFKKIQWDFWAFLRDNTRPQVKRPKTLKPKVKPKIYTPKPSAVEQAAPNLDDLYLHRLGRLNDWSKTYGQGMYE